MDCCFGKNGWPSSRRGWRWRCSSAGKHSSPFSTGNPTSCAAWAIESTAADQPAPRVIVHVTGYEPPQKGAIRGVVKVKKPDGSEQEIGTFGMFPDTAFQVDSSRARRYSFPLPKELATGAVKLKVEVFPDKAQGTGEGAQLEVGGAEIQ